MGYAKADPLVALAHEAQHQFDAGDFARAEQVCRRVLAMRPQHAESLHLLGLIAYSAHRYDDAVALMRQALSIQRGKPRHYSNLGLALQAQGNYEQALRAFRRAVTDRPAEAVFHLNLGSALKDAGEVESALVSFNRAVALDSSLAAAHFGRALCLLATARIAEAWGEHEWRIKYTRETIAGADDTPATYRLAQQPSEVPSIDLPGKRILVLKEQGLGDELFFLRYGPRIKAMGAGVAYWGSRKLVPLLAPSTWLDLVVDEDAPVPAHDYAFLVGDLPLLTANLTAEPPDALALTVTERARRAARERLASAGPAPYLGITWRAGREAVAGGPRTLHKSVPIDRLAQVLSQWRGTAIVLQRAPLAGEIEAFASASGLPTADLSGCNEDLELMLAVLELVDDYVGVSNTNMHLRAGLSKAARVLIPFPPEWRWTLKLERSPWFRTFPLYREDRVRGWEQSLAKLKADIAP